MKNIILLSTLFLFVATLASAQCVSGDCKDGQGVFEYGDGSKYEGTFKDAKRDGQGTLIFADDRKYIGEWKNGRPYGEGTMYYAEGKEEQGYFNGKYIGKNPPAESVAETETLPEEMNTKGGDTTGTETTTEEETAATTETEPMPEKVETTTSPAADNTERSDEVNPEDIKVWAVIVGVTDYTAMPPLQFSDDDAYQIYALYKSPAGGALPDEQIRLLINDKATKANIESAMRETFMKADENDVIMLYFSGHGLEGSFLPFDYDGSKNKLKHKNVRKILEESPAKHKLCIADACHSGSLVMSRGIGSASETIKTFYQAFSRSKGGTALFLSSKSNEVSLESNGLKQGVFSHFFMRGLKGEADTDKNNIVTITELYNFVHGNVKSTTLDYQSPVLDGQYDVNMPVGVVEQR